MLQRQYQESEARKANALTKFVDSQLSKEDFEAAKHSCTMRCQEIRREMASLELENDDAADLAAETFELLQDIPGLYVKAKPEVKREILEILLLNCAFDGVTLVPEWNKPFGAIAEGLILESGGPGRI